MPERDSPRPLPRHSGKCGSAGWRGGGGEIVPAAFVASALPLCRGVTVEGAFLTPVTWRPGAEAGKPRQGAAGSVPLPRGGGESTASRPAKPRQEGQGALSSNGAGINHNLHLGAGFKWLWHTRSPPWGHKKGSSTNTGEALTSHPRLLHFSLGIKAPNSIIPSLAGMKWRAKLHFSGVTTLPLQQGKGKQDHLRLMAKPWAEGSSCQQHFSLLCLPKTGSSLPSMLVRTDLWLPTGLTAGAEQQQHVKGGPAAPQGTPGAARAPAACSSNASCFLQAVPKLYSPSS